MCNLGIRNLRFFSSLTQPMFTLSERPAKATCYRSDVNDISAPHIQGGPKIVLNIKYLIFK